MTRSNQAVNVAYTYVKKIGLELEGWSTRPSSDGLFTSVDGLVTDDAGLHQCELITNPQSSVEAAIHVLSVMLTEHPMFLSPFRPDWLMEKAGCWQPKLIYAAKVAALVIESPEGEAWLRYNIPNYAALHVSVSGEFSAFSDAAAFLINMLIYIAVLHAAYVHTRLGYGFGHLNLYRFFALKERFSAHERWFSDGMDMVRFIQSIPRLFRAENDRFVLNPPGEFMSIEDRTDLGSIWWYARPKVGEHGSYLEIRHLPSMPLEEARVYVEQVVEMVELLLGWFYGVNGGRPVYDQSQAAGAYRVLHEYLPDCFTTAAPLSANDWHSLMQVG